MSDFKLNTLKVRKAFFYSELREHLSFLGVIAIMFMAYIIY